MEKEGLVQRKLLYFEELLNTAWKECALDVWDLLFNQLTDQEQFYDWILYDIFLKRF